MRTLQLAGSSLAFAAAFAACGCVLDVKGLEANAGGAGPSSSTVAGPDAASTGGGAASTTSAGCIPTAEDCENGQDEDCDGLIDCADPSCTDPVDGRECVAPAPSGWTLVAFAPGATTCPAGSKEMAKVAETPTFDSKCTCNCDCSGPKGNPCVHGTLSAKIGGMCTILNLTLPVTGGCDSLGVMFNTNYGSIKATPLGVTPIDLPGDPILPMLQPGAAGTTCAPDATMATGCTGGRTCLPKSTSASLCIQHPGALG